MTRPRPSHVRAATAATAGLALAGAFALPASAGIVDEPISHSAPGAALELAPIGTYETGIFDEGASEIVGYDAGSQRLIVINAAQALVEVLDVSDPAAPVKLFDVPTAGVGSADESTVPGDAVANSVDVRADGLGAIAVEAGDKVGNGWVVFFDARSEDGAPIGAVRVGALPDMVTFTPDGSQLLVANEGEPAEDYSVDPEGSVAVIDVPDALDAPAQGDVAIADFHAFEEGGSLELPEGVRIYGGREDAGTGIPEFPVSENLEPEYITVVGDRAFVTLQEANALAEVDLAGAEVTAIHALGTKDWSQPGNELDPSDEDGGINLGNWPVQGLYQPDAIGSYVANGVPYLVTANEGDTRDWEGYSEVARVKDLGEDGLLPVCEDLADLTADEALGRLNITTADGLSGDGTCYETLYANGGRSFSIWSTAGGQIFDSGAQFEELTAEALPEFFNSNHSESNLEGRSDDKGPEPEGLAIGTVGDSTYAFVGFERVGGVVVFDITAPDAVEFVTYVNNRDFAVSVEDGGALADAGDLGPEGLEFIPADVSPIEGTALLAIGNEVSGSTTFYRIDEADGGPGGDEDGAEDGSDDGGDDSGSDESGSDESGSDESGSGESGSGESGADENGTDDGAAESGDDHGADDGAGDDGADESGADGGELPDTGAGAATLMLTAGALLLAGAAGYAVRRRTA
ncbi:choice-of-anchor I family protein [Jiangella ureilytica]|uniref:choice-of-anchor I family protein n=1 Tax=Jiangella ureilytica TaxID=2530374 RepID=UPI00193CEE77|nr:choice-of-anchor I family protein [Jiangella ureilytica]